MNGSRGDDEKTPVETFSPAARLLADLAAEYATVRDRLAEAAKRVDELEGDTRRALLLTLGITIGDLGDTNHATRQGLRDFAIEGLTNEDIRRVTDEAIRLLGSLNPDI